MEYEYSKIMKRLMSKWPRIIVHIIFVLVIITLLIGCIYGFQLDGKQIKDIKEKARKFDAVNENTNYSKLSPEYLSELF